ncbi:hypothetical protein K8I61_20110 [bacterium]|nr:hypothetical protein [bacterium]
MENLQEMVKDLRGIIHDCRAAFDNEEKEEKVQTQVRTRVKEQLTRKDLRLPVEIALVEILHEFDGFDIAPREIKSEVLEDAEKLLSRIDMLIETESVVTLERVELPSPPAIIADMIEKEEAARRREERVEREARRALATHEPTEEKGEEPRRRRRRGRDRDRRVDEARPPEALAEPKRDGVEKRTEERDRRDRDRRERKPRERGPRPEGPRPEGPREREARRPKPAENTPAPLAAAPASEPGTEAERTELKFQRDAAGEKTGQGRRRGRRRRK